MSSEKAGSRKRRMEAWLDINRMLTSLHTSKAAVCVESNAVNDPGYVEADDKYEISPFWVNFVHHTPLKSAGGIAFLVLE